MTLWVSGVEDEFNISITHVELNWRRPPHHKMNASVREILLLVLEFSQFFRDGCRVDFFNEDGFPSLTGNYAEVI
jgi:hypothetical protein